MSPGDAPREQDPFARLERAIAAACFDREAEARLTSDPRAFLAERGLSPAEIDHLAPRAARLVLYRTLVRNNLGQVVFQVLPRTRALFTRRGGPPAPRAFDVELGAFLEERASRDHTLRAVPHELVAWATPRWRALGDAVPAWSVDLATHEARIFAVATRERPSATAAAGPVALDRPVLFEPTLELAHYEHAVHEVGDEGEAPAPPEPRPVDLAVFRDEEDEVQLVELDPLGATLVARLLDGATLERATRAAAAVLGGDVTAPDRLAEIARILGALGEVGALRGGAT